MSFARSSRGRLGPALFAFVVSAALARSVQAADDAEPVPAEPAPTAEARRQMLCEAAANASLPRSAAERRALLQRLEALRERCIDRPAFLAALGGNWLEEGNAVQALLWLERSLMLDPQQLGAKADHALALQALGERQALEDLLRDWRLRTDIPPPLVERLVAAAGRPEGTTATGPDGNGNGQRRWAQSREVMALFGYESNLDRSPRYSELTLTPPLEDPITLPFVQKPRAGAAVIAEGSWQAARSLTPTSLILAGIQAAARTAPTHSSTDWHHLQLAGSASQRWSRLRAELQASVTAVGGPLNEPYRLERWSLSLQSNGLGCSHRLSLDFETRRQSQTDTANSRSNAGSWNSSCPLSFAGGWTIGGTLRAGTDKPDSPIRPGGIQRQWSAGLRGFGPVGTTGQMEVSLRYTRAQDSEPYLLDLFGTTRRALEPVQLSLEYSHPVALLGSPDSDFVVQVQAVRQSSSLELFRYSSLSAFSGLRWRW